jgi:hypothetical protein
MAFSASAFAVDVKFSGEFYAAHMFLDKTTFKKDTATDGPSTALFFQRLRVRTDFVVSPGLSVITRMDIMERAWGATRSTPGTTADSYSQGTAAENENIAFDYAYLQYATPIGIFAAGWMGEGGWGTIFGNTAIFGNQLAKLSYTIPVGNFMGIIQYGQSYEGSMTRKNAAGYADDDVQHLYLMGIYNYKGGDAGLIYIFIRNATTRPASDYQGKMHGLSPYFRATLGPVKLQGEVWYYFGQQREYDVTGTDVDYDAWGGWLDAVATFGPVYVGGTFAYLQGDNDSTDTKNHQVVSGGWDWQPTLLMFNAGTRYYWAGSIAGHGTSADNGAMSNAWFYQVRAGVKPTEKLDIMTSLSYAYADKKPSGYDSDVYGWEVDVTGTYKITNNLSYMLGVGYMVVGDYYKATSTANNLDNNFIVLNKLTLTF